MNVLRFNPFVWLLLLALSYATYFVRVSDAFDLPFKLTYNFAGFALMYLAVVFETWRLEGINWKELCQKNVRKNV